MCNASLIRCDVTTSINLSHPLPYGSQRKRSIKKALKSDLVVEREYEIEEYWEILNQVLNSKHNAQSVHTVEEMKYLMSKFPDNIKLYVAKQNSVVLAGTIIFESEFVAHTQYLANSERGKACGALDIVIDTLISDVYKNKKYFDFGISNENEGRYLNQGLITQKEGFGARAVVHKQYEILIHD
nr:MULTISPECIES: GNAT family N-acetyltransferase [unclassified Vibrio]